MKLLFLLISLLIVNCSYGQRKHNEQQKQRGKDYSAFLINPKMYLDKDSTVIERIDKYHPHLYESLTEKERDSLEKLIHQRKLQYSDDSITVSNHFFLWKPLIDRLNYEDPHYWVIPRLIIANKKFKENDIHVVPINLLIIGDTAIVDKTCDPLFHIGDRILSVNGTPIEDFLGVYPMRYVSCMVLQQYHHFAFTPQYAVEIERKGEKMLIETTGGGYQDIGFELSKGSWTQKIYHEFETGYFELDNFYPNNSRLINRLTSFVKEVQKAGYKNIVIDTRRNTGGYGHNFDYLFSLFTNKDTLQYVIGNKVRVSEFVAKDYNLSMDSIGKLMEIPEPYANKYVPLHPKKYLGEMNYYVLISKNTQSMAASFANVLQYNGLAQLVGEPLLNNALKYGEVIQLGWGIKSNVEVYSTVQIDEYTKSPDGQVYPDIEIPYVASEYMNGGDPVLEKLISYIENQR